MKRIILCMLLCLAMVLSMAVTGFAASPEAEAAAQALNKLGLFEGTGKDENGDPIFRLERAPSRAEAITMLVRLLGKEDEAIAGSWDTPFTDVPEWALPYVGYAYANKLTDGTGPETFGSSRRATATQYLTFVLRALGYSDEAGDFKWDSAWTLTDELGITHGEYNAENNKEFLRADCALVSLKALSAKLKDKAVTLLDSLGLKAPEEPLPQESEDTTQNDGSFEPWDGTEYTSSFGSTENGIPKPEILWATKAARIYDKEQDRYWSINPGDVMLVNIPKDVTPRVYYTVEDITDNEPVLFEEGSQNTQDSVRSVCKLSFGTMGDGVIQAGHSYLLKVYYMTEDMRSTADAVNSGNFSSCSFTFTEDVLGPSYKPATGLKWVSENELSWALPEDEDYSRARAFVRIVFENENRKLKGEDNQHGMTQFTPGDRMDTMTIDSASDEDIKELIEAGGRDAKYRFSVRFICYDGISSRNTSEWSEWSDWFVPEEQ